jgi:hypothetical protein
MSQVGTSDDIPAAAPGRPVDTLKLLNQRIPEVLLEQQPLEQVMEFIADITQMNVVVRWQILEDAGIERDKEITVKVRNLPLRQVLWMILNEAGGSDLKLAYRASGNLLVLSTQEDLGEEMIVKVYDVSDLLFRPRWYGQGVLLDPSQALQQAGQQSGQGGTGGGSGQGIFGGGGQGSQNTQRNEDDDESGVGMQEILQLIVDTVEPDSWTQNGGIGTIYAFRNLLVVRNSILVHQRLSGYVVMGD